MIFLVGHHASGKTEAAQFLANKFGFLHIETSGIVKDYKAATADQMPFAEWERRMLSSFGESFLDDLIVATINARLIEETGNGTRFQEVVITGNRQMSGVRYIAEHRDHLKFLPIAEYAVIGIHVHPDSLYRRYVTRNRDLGDALMSREDFEQRIIEKERQRGLANLMANADIIIDNTTEGHPHLEDQLIHVFRGILGYELRDRIQTEGQISAEGHYGPGFYK